MEILYNKLAKQQHILELLIPHILFNNMSLEYVVNKVDGNPKLKVCGKLMQRIKQQGFANS